MNFDYYLPKQKRKSISFFSVIEAQKHSRRTDTINEFQCTQSIIVIFNN